MNRIRTMSAALLAVGALAALPALATEPETRSADARFARMDANKDGRLTAEEHSAGARRMFAAMDGNEDGQVSAAEMDAARQESTGEAAAMPEMSAAEKIKVVDTNGDGILTADEHAAGSRSMFAKMDSNGDGHLTQEELSAGHAAHMKKH